jgi:NTP pyrophosphatase (non-canonical NTP hydrolase)
MGAVSGSPVIMVIFVASHSPMHQGIPPGTAPVADLAAEVDAWITTTGVRYFDPLTNMAMLSEEVGEVARIMARRFGEQSEKESDKAKDLGEELSDVLFVVLCLANQTGTDLQSAWTRRMAAKTERDKDRHANNPKLG